VLHARLINIVHPACRPELMTSPLRVLTIGHSYVVAGNRCVVRRVAADPGFEVTVAAPTYFHGDLRPITLEPEPPGSPLRLVGLPASWTRFVHCFRYDTAALNRLLADGRFDVVHAWEEPFVLASAQLVVALRGLPARFCFRTAQNQVKWYPPPFRWFERTVVRRADGWVAGGRLVAEAMLARDYPPERGRVIPLAVDPAAYRPLSAEERRAALAEVGLKPPVIGFAGRLVAAKGLDLLMRALEGLPAGRPWSLLVLGSGPYGRRILRWARARGWADRVCVRLVPHQDVPRYLGAMDLLAAPSQSTRRWKEQFGRVLVEAMACGVPVLASDSGEIPLVLGDAGRVLPERDPAAWTAALTELLADPAARAELAARGRVCADRYSADAVARTWREYYRWLAGQPNPDTPAPAPKPRDPSRERLMI
jgi:glycosyltransferase involved in cell wall biosynthesis